MTTIPAYYFPTSIYFIMPDISFLTKLLPQVNDQQNSYHIGHDPKTLSQSLLERARVIKPLQALDPKHDVPLTKDNYLMELDLSAICQIVHEARRFEEVSVVVVDYNLGSMKGTEFCRELRTQPLKKILLIEEKDQAFAMQAVNNGSIDRFLIKDAHMAPLLKQYIFELKQEYFIGFSRKLMTLLAQYSPHIFYLDFIQFFQEKCQQYHIVEYYLLDAAGSYLLIDAIGTLYCLAVKSDRDIEVYLAKARHNRGAEELITSLKNRVEMPFFLNVADCSEYVDRWLIYFHAVEKLTLKKYPIYYSLVKDFTHPDLTNVRIKSWEQYRAGD